MTVLRLAVALAMISTAALADAVPAVSPATASIMEQARQSIQAARHRDPATVPPLPPGTQTVPAPAATTAAPAH